MSDDLVFSGHDHDALLSVDEMDSVWSSNAGLTQTFNKQIKSRSFYNKQFDCFNLPAYDPSVSDDSSRSINGDIFNVAKDLDKNKMEHGRGFVKRGLNGMGFVESVSGCGGVIGAFKKSYNNRVENRRRNGGNDVHFDAMKRTTKKCDVQFNNVSDSGDGPVVNATSQSRALPKFNGDKNVIKLNVPDVVTNYCDDVYVVEDHNDIDHLESLNKVLESCSDGVQGGGVGSSDLNCSSTPPTTGFSKLFKESASNGDNLMKVKKVDAINVLLMNARSLQDKAAEVATVAEELETDILLITETWMDGLAVQVRGFVKVALDSKTKGHGGGSAIYVRQRLFASCREIAVKNKKNSDNGFQIAAIECLDFTIVCVYRSPSIVKGDSCTQAKLANILEKNFKNSSKLIICGDFNLPSIKSWDNEAPMHGSRSDLFLKNMSDSLGWHQIIHEPTHDLGNILDLVFVEDLCDVSDAKVLNQKDYFSDYKLDHKLITFRINLNQVLRNETKKVIILHKKLDIQKYHEELDKCNLNKIEHDYKYDLNAYYGAIKDAIISSYMKAVPTKPITEGVASKLDQEVKSLVKKVRKFRRKRDWRNFRIFKKRLNGAHQKMKKDDLMKWIQKMDRDRNHLYKTFKEANNGKKSIRCLQDPDGNYTRDEKEMADLLQQKYTGNFGDKTEKSVNWEDSIGDKEKLDSILLTEEEVESKINSLPLKTSCGMDEVNNIMLRKAIRKIVRHLTNIYNLSIQTGVFPEDSKVTRVLPVPKGGDLSLVENWRPVSLGSNFFKPCESMIRDRIEVFLDNSAFFSESQFGFSFNISREDNLTKHLKRLLDITNGGGKASTILWDYKAAFDLVDHGILLDKLYACGVTGMVGRWIENWLKDREQEVEINQKRSVRTAITSGVLQGSVLGPTLFKIFVNDAPNIVVNIDGVWISLFADDTKMAARTETEEEAAKLQLAIDGLVEYSEFNKMKPNLKKLVVLHHNHVRGSEPRFTADGVEIPAVDSAKDLGVLVDRGLTFGDHFSRNYGRAYQATIQSLRRIKGSNFSTFHLVWNLYILPVLINGVLITGIDHDKKAIKDFHRIYRIFWSKKCPPKDYDTPMPLPPNLQVNLEEWIYIFKIRRNMLKVTHDVPSIPVVSRKHLDREVKRVPSTLEQLENLNDRRKIVRDVASRMSIKFDTLMSTLDDNKFEDRQVKFNLEKFRVYIRKNILEQTEDYKNLAGSLQRGRLWSQFDAWRIKRNKLRSS